MSGRVSGRTEGGTDFRCGNLDIGSLQEGHHRVPRVGLSECLEDTLVNSETRRTSER